MKWCETTLLNNNAFYSLLENINLKIIKTQMKHLKSSLPQQISLSIKHAVWHEMDNLKGQPERLLSDLQQQPQLAGIYLKHTSLTEAKYWIKTFTLMGLWQTYSFFLYYTETTQHEHHYKIYSIWLPLKLDYNEYLLIYFSKHYCKECSSSFTDVSWK